MWAPEHLGARYRAEAKAVILVYAGPIRPPTVKEGEGKLQNLHTPENIIMQRRYLRMLRREIIY